MTKLKLTGKSNILKKTSSSINKKDFLLAVKEAAECPEDSCGVGGNSDGYLYKEVDINSAELLNPGTIPVGNFGTGKELLPPCVSTQHYEWKFSIEFIPGSESYSSWSPIVIFPDYLSIQMSTPQILQALTSNVYAVWKGSNIYGYDGYYGNTGGEGLYADWEANTWLDGNGTIKVKLWYKVINFG